MTNGWIGGLTLDIGLWTLDFRLARFLAFVAMMTFAGRAVAADSAADNALPLTESRIVEQVTASVDKALTYIAEKQRPDGGWHDNNAPNALSMLAFMGRGHVPGRGPYREVLARGKKCM